MPFKEKKNSVLFLNICSRSRDIQVFAQSIDDITNRFSTKINNKIKNISGNFGEMLLKLGTSNASQVTNKITPITIAMVLLSAPVPLYYELNISIFYRIRTGKHSYSKRTKWPYCSTSLHELMGANDV